MFCTGNPSVISFVNLLAYTSLHLPIRYNFFFAFFPLKQPRERQNELSVGYHVPNWHGARAVFLSASAREPVATAARGPGGGGAGGSAGAGSPGGGRPASGPAAAAAALRLLRLRPVSPLPAQVQRDGRRATHPPLSALRAQQTGAGAGCRGPR